MKRPLSPRAKKNLRIMRNIHLAVLGLVVLAPMGIEFVSQRGLREIKRQMRAEGLPLTPAELTRPLPPADQNAAPLYVHLTDMLEKQPLKGDDKVLDEVTKQLPPPAEHLAQLRQALARRHDVVSLIHQAAQKPQCVFNRNYALGPDMLFPEYAKMRGGLRVLTNESLILLADGKTLDAIRNEAMGFKMAQHAASEPTLISKLVGVALNAITLHFMERVLYTAGDQPGVAQAVADAISQNWKTVSMADGMRGEIILGEVVFDMLRAGKFHADAKDGLYANAVARRPSSLSVALLDANELNLLTYQQENLHLMMGSYMNSKAGLDRLDREARSYPYLPTRYIATILVPVFSQARSKQAQGEAQAAVVRMAALAFAYRQSRGQFPDEWAQTNTPASNDPFSDHALTYRREKEGFVLYSAGPTGAFSGGAAGRKPDSKETVFRFPMPAYYTQPSASPLPPTAPSN